MSFPRPHRFSRNGWADWKCRTLFFIFYFGLSGRWPIEWSWPAASPARTSRLDWLTKNRERDGRVEAAHTFVCQVTCVGGSIDQTKGCRAPPTTVVLQHSWMFFNHRKFNFKLKFLQNEWREIVSYPEANNSSRKNNKSADSKREESGAVGFLFFYFVSFPEAKPEKNTYLPTVHQRDWSF